MSATALSRRPGITAVGASIVAGAALWLSRASFDLAGTMDAPVRVAMLPSLPELAGLITLALFLAAAVATLLRERPASSVERPRLWDPGVADVLTPLLALALLALPYLPWLPDVVPPLRLLAGPGRALVWAVVLGQLTWLFCSEFAKRRRLNPIESFGPFACSLAIFVVSLAVYGWALSRVASGQDADRTLLVVTAGIAALTWLSAFALSHSKAAATFAWASTCLTAPFVLNSREVVPGAFVDLYNTLRQLPEATFQSFATAVPGVLFDQEFGIVAYAPVLLLAFVGLGGMARERSVRWLAIASSVAVLALIALAGSVDPWWSEVMPGRRVLLLMPVLAPPIAWLYARTAAHPLRRAGVQALLLVSLGVALAIIIGVDRVPVPQEGDGASSLLEWMSPVWQLWRDAPSYVASDAATASTRTLLWLAGFAALSGVFMRRFRGSAGLAALVATTASVISVIAVISASGVLPAGSHRSRFDPEGRVLFPLLEAFDSIRRPIGVRYDPLTFVNPGELPGSFSLAAVPGQRLSRQPVRVVLNARFRLPAGEYEVVFTGSDLAAPVPDAAVSLQIGRGGRPLETWPLALTPSGPSAHRFHVPVDAEFVGFRATRQVESSMGGLRLRALRVVDVPRRFQTPTVISAADFGAARVFFHDGNSYSESEGFWVRGRAAARLTILKASESDSSVTLAIHSGARPNTLTLTTRSWSERIELVPGVTTKVAVPSKPGEPFIPMSIATTDGFVPAEVERGSRDRRLLGAWIAFTPDDTSRTSAAP